MWLTIKLSNPVLIKIRNFKILKFFQWHVLSSWWLMDGGDNSRDYILDQYLPNIEIKMETSIKGSLTIFWVAWSWNKTYLDWVIQHDLTTFIKKFKLNEKLKYCIRPYQNVPKVIRSNTYGPWCCSVFWLFWQVTSGIYTRREGCLTDQKTILVKILSGLRIEFGKKVWEAKLKYYKRNHVQDSIKNCQYLAQHF